ncbi:MAG: DUF2269 family protein [Alphaproteobacteria bacterium]|nr:DUF2269 family protein [Alphaproteobacteria bacterium]
MTLFLFAKWLHILSAAMLFGTGLGIAFFMFAAWRAKDATVFAGVARLVVLADWLFTASAVVLQPLTGAALIHLSGRSWSEPWIVASLALYAVAGAFWLPVVWIQRRVAKLAETGADAPQRQRLMWIWFWCGWPAFASVLAIYALMIVKPA